MSTTERLIKLNNDLLSLDIFEMVKNMTNYAQIKGKYEKIKTIGSGSYSTMYLFLNTQKNQLVARKTYIVKKTMGLSCNNKYIKTDILVHKYLDEMDTQNDFVPRYYVCYKKELNYC